MLAQLSFVILQWPQAAMLPKSTPTNRMWLCYRQLNACPAGVATPLLFCFCISSAHTPPGLVWMAVLHMSATISYRTLKWRYAVVGPTGPAAGHGKLSRGLLLSTIEMLVVGVLPAEICRVRWLVAICSRVCVPKPKFFSGLITNKPIWLCLIIITKAVQENMHILTVRHIESPHCPHRTNHSLISLDKCMLKEKSPGRRHPKLLHVPMQVEHRFKFY